MRSLNCCPMMSALSPLRTPWSFASSAPIVSGLKLSGLQEGAVTIRDLVRHALRHRPDHIVVGEVRGGEAADLLQALNTGHGGSLTTVHANNAESALSRLASCAMQGGGELAVGGDLPRRGGWDCDGHSHDAARGAALCRGGRVRQRLRSEGEPMVY